MFAKQVCTFIGGPIQHATRPDGSFHAGTRTIIEQVIAAVGGLGHKVLSAHVHERFGELDVSGKFQEVCSRDYRWMLQCDLFLAVLPLDETGSVILSSGTAIELGWASALNKSIILVCDPAARYSHLIIGLDAIADVVKVDINRNDLPTAVCEAVAQALGRRRLPGIAEASAHGWSLPQGAA